MSATKIMLVDDHPAMRHGLAQLINAEADLDVCGEADDRPGAMAVFERRRPDLVVVDVALKDSSSSGLDLVCDLRARRADLPILVYSMHDEALYAERALRMGARGYLMKQQPVRELLVAVRRVLDGGVYVSPAITSRLLLRHVGDTRGPLVTDPTACLSSREFEVFRLIGKGLPPREIGEVLHLSPKTIETHRQNIRKKLGLMNASELTRRAVEWGRKS